MYDGISGFVQKGRCLVIPNRKMGKLVCYIAQKYTEKKKLSGKIPQWGEMRYFSHPNYFSRHLKKLKELRIVFFLCVSSLR